MLHHTRFVNWDGGDTAGVGLEWVEGFTSPTRQDIGNTHHGSFPLDLSRQIFDGTQSF